MMDVTIRCSNCKCYPNPWTAERVATEEYVSVSDCCLAPYEPAPPCQHETLTVILGVERCAVCNVAAGRDAFVPFGAPLPSRTRKAVS